MELDYKVSTETIPTNKSSKYDGVIDEIKKLQEGQHLQVNNSATDKETAEEVAENTSNAIRSAAKSRGIKLAITKRGSVLYIKIAK